MADLKSAQDRVERHLISDREKIILKGLIMFNIVQRKTREYGTFAEKSFLESQGDKLKSWLREGLGLLAKRSIPNVKLMLAGLLSLDDSATFFDEGRKRYVIKVLNWTESKSSFEGVLRYSRWWIGFAQSIRS